MLNAHTIFGYGFPLYLYFTKKFRENLRWATPSSLSNIWPSRVDDPRGPRPGRSLARENPAGSPEGSSRGDIAGSFARARAARAHGRAPGKGQTFSRGFQTHTSSSVEVDRALHGRCTDIHRCRSPEKTCPEGLTRAWENLLYPKKTGKVCHGRSLGAPWTSADVLWRFCSVPSRSSRSG